MRRFAVAGVRGAGAREKVGKATTPCDARSRDASALLAMTEKAKRLSYYNTLSAYRLAERSQIIELFRCQFASCVTTIKRAKATIGTLIGPQRLALPSRPPAWSAGPRWSIRAISTLTPIATNCGHRGRCRHGRSGDRENPLGQRTSSKARDCLGPDPRRALGPAAICMQPSLPPEPIDQNIKAVDVAEFAKIADFATTKNHP
jgi:hypothetical protein